MKQTCFLFVPSSKAYLMIVQYDGCKNAYGIWSQTIQNSNLASRLLSGDISGYQLMETFESFCMS